MKQVIVVPHDPRWRGEFERESARVIAALGANAVAIHHIGSTAIRGIHAKPVIDMLVEVKGLDAVDAKNEAMIALGYEALGEFGIWGRRYFRKDNKKGIRTHQVHVFVAGGAQVRRHVDFRDYLIANPEAAREYSDLKRRLAADYPNDMDSYIAGKDGFIKDIDRKALHKRFPAHRMIAAAFESLESFAALVQEEPELMEEREGLGETPLHFLTVENQIRAVKILIEAGAEVNTLNRCNGTPLSEAASLGYAELVDLLLTAGASIDIDGQSEPTLHEAVRGGNLDAVRRIIEAGAPIDQPDSLRNRPLHLAAESDETLDILKILIEFGADPNLKGSFNETPLDVARNSGAVLCAETLETDAGKRGRDPEV